MVWGQFNPRETSFIRWLAMQDRLATRAPDLTWGPSVSRAYCVLCGDGVKGGSFVF